MNTEAGKPVSERSKLLPCLKSQLWADYKLSVQIKMLKFILEIVAEIRKALLNNIVKIFIRKQIELI